VTALALEVQDYTSRHARSTVLERVPVFAVELVLTVRWPSEAVENTLPTASEGHRVEVLVVPSTCSVTCLVGSLVASVASVEVFPVSEAGGTGRLVV